MNAVPAGFAADEDNQIAGFVFPALCHFHRHQPHRAAINQWICQIAFVKKNGAIDRRDTESIAVVRHAGADTLENTAGM